jgi:hypothetical protein
MMVRLTCGNRLRTIERRKKKEPDAVSFALIFPTTAHSDERATTGCGSMAGSLGPFIRRGAPARLPGI